MTFTDAEVDGIVRDIIREHGKIKAASAISASDDLYRLGLSSLATVNVMMDLEERFRVTIPEAALTRATFQTIGAMAALVQRLCDESVVS